LIDKVGGYGTALNLARAVSGEKHPRIVDLGKESLWKAFKRQIFSTGAPVEGKSLLDIWRQSIFQDTIRALAQDLLGLSTQQMAPQMKIHSVPKVE